MLIPSDSKKLKALVDRKHPEYAGKIPHWDFLYETYLGSQGWFKKHIFQFNREGSETYEGRLRRAYRFNHTREVVDLVNKYLFKVAPKRSEKPPAHLDRFRKQATLSGLSLLDFERQVGRMSSIFGRVYCVVDNNLRGTVPTTVAEEREVNARLYAYVVTPKHFRDCGYDDNGHFNWVLLSELNRDDDDPFESSGKVVERFRLWTKTHWALFEVDAKRKSVDVVDQGEHGLGVVPVIKCDHIESDEKYVVPALIEDIAYLDRAVANYLSNLDQIINDQTFSQLVMPAQGVMPGVSTSPSPRSGGVDSPTVAKQEQELRQTLMKLGTSQVLIYDGEHGDAPSYIAPDPRQANLLMSAIKQIINEIYHTVGLAGERTKSDNSQGIDNSSGVAKAFDFERVNALLSAKATSMQAFSNRLEALVRIYGGESPELLNDMEDTVVYSMNFDVRSLADEIQIGHELSLLGIPMEVRRKQIKGIIEKLWPLIEDAEQKKLEKAIDAWEDSLQTSVTRDLPNAESPDGNLGQGAVGGKEAMKDKLPS